ncbi:MAG: type II toxin-antitoxin system mRNA interferase toxin, RelE/StbE family [Armatimonadota bacterium]
MYKLQFKKTVKKDLKKLGQKTAKKIIREIRNKLLADPKIGTPLKGKEGVIWKWRVGDYRVVYTFNNKELFILIIRIAHRKDVYRTL